MINIRKIITLYNTTVAIQQFLEDEPKVISPQSLHDDTAASLATCASAYCAYFMHFVALQHILLYRDTRTPFPKKISVLVITNNI